MSKLSRDSQTADDRGLRASLAINPAVDDFKATFPRNRK
jgi:hypothetical protein